MAEKRHVTQIPASQETRRVARFYIDALERRVQIGVRVIETGQFESYEFTDEKPEGSEEPSAWEAILAAHPEMRKIREMAQNILFERGIENPLEWEDDKA